ncbi:MAG: MFS transporter [Candidatus Pacebacteria bacterium]|nr:MFS transporter [Candidatus Paceibacterota bacterium]
MQLFHIFHQNRLRRLIHSDFWLFEVSVWLHTFARSMVTIFVPIFLLQIGYSISEVIVYYLIFNLIDVPLNFVARNFVKKIGARWVIILGSIASVAFFIGIYNLKSDAWPLLILIAFLAAVYDTFYWVAHLYLFMKCSKNDDNVSGDTSKLSIIQQIASFLAPLLGALILIYLNRSFLIVVSILILIISIVPLFMIKDFKDKPIRKQKTFREFFHNWSITRDYVISAFRAISNTSERVIWPLFLYTLFKNIESVAVLPMIISLTAIMFTYFVGKTVMEKRESLMTVGATIVALVWILRLVIENNAFYYISVFLMGLFSILISLPLDSYIFEKGEKLDTLSASTYRNTTHMSANVVFFGVLILLVNVFDISFVLASLSMIFVASIIYFLGEKTLKT